MVTFHTFLFVSDEILDLYDRLFNHRPFLKGEISRFVSEFEKQRGETEVENLFKALELTTELQTTKVKKLSSDCESAFPSIDANLLVAQSMSNKILEQARNSELVSG